MTNMIYIMSITTKQRHIKENMITNTQHCCTFIQTYEIRLAFQEVDLLKLVTRILVFKMNALHFWKQKENIEKTLKYEMTDTQ